MYNIWTAPTGVLGNFVHELSGACDRGWGGKQGLHGLWGLHSGSCHRECYVLRGHLLERVGHGEGDVQQESRSGLFAELMDVTTAVCSRDHTCTLWS